jgi:hypothetical protein
MLAEKEILPNVFVELAFGGACNFVSNGSNIGGRSASTLSLHPPQFVQLTDGAGFFFPVEIRPPDVFFEFDFERGDWIDFAEEEIRDVAFWDDSVATADLLSEIPTDVEGTETAFAGDQQELTITVPANYDWVD